MILVLIGAVASMAQIAAGVQVGYGQPAFEKHEPENGAFQLGIHAGTTILPAMELGAEINTSLTPFVMKLSFTHT